MIKNEASFFFRFLHDLESINGDDSPLYIEGYDYVMEIVKDAIFGDPEIENMYDLDNFINQADSRCGVASHRFRGDVTLEKVSTKSPKAFQNTV
jgi:hypothetical protein